MFLQGLGEVTSRPAAGHGGHLFRRAFRHKPPAAIASFGSQIHDPVRRFYHVEIMLDDNDRIAVVDKFVEHFQKLARVFEVQPGRWLVENIERPSCRPAGEFL